MARMGDVAPTRALNHTPAPAVSGVSTTVTTASNSTSQISRRRAAGHSAQTIARTATSGASTTTKWLSRMWAGSPLNVETSPLRGGGPRKNYQTVVFTRAAADSGIGSYRTKVRVNEA